MQNGSSLLLQLALYSGQDDQSYSNSENIPRAQSRDFGPFLFISHGALNLFQKPSHHCSQVVHMTCPKVGIFQRLSLMLYLLDDLNNKNEKK